jgi:hypothetical protein
MAYTTIVSGTNITSSWANASVRDQVVSPFGSTAARAAAITGPLAGMVSTLTTNAATEGVEVYNSAGQWRLPWNMPWGFVSLTTLASDVSYSAGTFGFPSFQWNGTGVVARRLYKATVNFEWGTASTVGQIDFGIGTAAGTGVGYLISVYQDTLSAPRFDSHSIVFTTTAGSMTRGLTILKNTGGGSVNVIAGATLLIEDIGPAGAPA